MATAPAPLATSVAPRAKPQRRVFNFAAGPSMMPRPVLERARAELLDWNRTGLSMWELPFTGHAFRDLIARLRARLRALLAIPDDYEILLMHGGASAQFALVPLNLLRGRPSADYVLTGHWSRKALIEGRRYCQGRIAARAHGGAERRLPRADEWRLDARAAYCHVTANETADGLEFADFPDTAPVPLVVDMTSSFLSRPVDVSRVGVIYAGAQKNVGPAGLVFVILRRDLIGGAHPACPSVFDYGVQARAESCFNTPATYAVYLADLVLEWIEGAGGLAAMAAAAARRSARLYAAIDASSLYCCPVAPSDRSRMNVVFKLTEPRLNEAFLAGAETEGLVNLRGHSALGGVRASLYNATPEAAVTALIDYMDVFERRVG